MSQKNDTRGNCYKNMKSARNIEENLSQRTVFLGDLLCQNTKDVAR